MNVRPSRSRAQRASPDHDAPLPARRARSRAAPRALGAVTAASLLLAAVACTSEKKAPEASPRAQRYTFRGEVMRLPEPGVKKPEITLRHERIPDFVNQEGKTVGMDAMVMPFEIGPGASLEGVEVGDVVEVRLAVDWSAPSFRLEQVKELPAGTALEFGRGPAPGAGHAAAAGHSPAATEAGHAPASTTHGPGSSK